MRTFDEVLALAAPSETTVPLVLGGQYLEQIRQLEQKLRDAAPPASLAERNPATVIAEQIAELQERMRGTEVDFHLRAMPGRQWDKFKFLQPTRAKDEDDDAFLARFFDWLCQLVSKTCIDPVMTAEQVAALVDRMPGSSWDTLSDTAWGQNAGKVTVPFSAAAYAWTSASDETSKRQPNSESATPASAATSPPKRRRTRTTKPVA